MASVIQHLNADPPDAVVLSNMANQSGQPAGGVTAGSWEPGLSAVIRELPESQVLVIADTPQLPGTPSICLSANLESADKCAQPRHEVIQSSWAHAEVATASVSGATLLELTRC